MFYFNDDALSLARERKVVSDDNVDKNEKDVVSMPRKTVNSLNYGIGVFISFILVELFSSLFLLLDFKVTSQRNF